MPGMTATTPCGDPQDRTVEDAPDHRCDRQGDERRSGEDSPRGRLGLPRQAGGHRPDALGHARLAPSVNEKSGERVNILAVDDSPEKLLALSAVLSELDQNVVTAASGRDALRHLLRQEFAVVLLDVNMPGLDGSRPRSSSASARAPSTRRSFSSRLMETRRTPPGILARRRGPHPGTSEPEVLKTKVMVFCRALSQDGRGPGAGRFRTEGSPAPAPDGGVPRHQLRVVDRTHADGRRGSFTRYPRGPPGRRHHGARPEMVHAEDGRFSVARV